MNLKNIRKIVNVSQTELAKEVGLSNNYISILERKNKTPSLQVCKKISDYLIKKGKEKNIPIEIFSIEKIFLNN